MKILVQFMMNYSDQLSNVYTYVLFPTSVTFVLFFILRTSRANSNKKLPPSPSKIPLIGNLHQFGSLPHRKLNTLAKIHGPIMSMQIGHVPTIVVSSSDIAFDVMKTQDLNFASRPHNSMAKLLMYDSDMAFAPYGEYWRQIKKLLSVHLLSNKMVQSFQSIREEEVQLMIDKIHETYSELVNLSDLITMLTSDIICRVALGKRYNAGVGDARKVRYMLHEFTELLGSFPVGDFFPWLSWLDSLSGLNSRAKKNSRELDEFLEGVIEEHIQARKDGDKDYNDEHSNFVDLLLWIEENNEIVGVSFGRNNVKALILDVFAAGTDTIFTVIEWAMAELITNPRIMKKVQEEIREVAGYSQYVTDKEVNKMIYLKATVKETLRLHPPLPLLPRETITDVEVKGYHIPKGTRAVVNVWAIGQDPKIWENPEEFSPDRFMDNGIDFRGQDFEFTPFGAGRRICPGINFSIPTVELALANLLHSFNWEVPKSIEKEVTDMSEVPGFIIHKKSALVLVAEPWKV